MQLSMLNNGPRLILLFLMAILLAGCARTEGVGKESGDARAPRRTTAPGPELAAPASGVRTVQLYRGSDERTLPILPLRGGAQLTLEFDLMEPQGRPLTIHFYHADRTWERDLVPSQYLTSFSDDNLLDHTSSSGTQVPYTHYAYRFPNESIGFQVSGNYILRVTEQGREDEVLFERVFFVTEQAGPLDLGLEARRVQVEGPPSQVPVAQFTPPASLPRGTLGYDVCFMAGGSLDALRCDSEALLGGASSLTFRLPTYEAFVPEPAAYLLDLSLLQVNNQISEVERMGTSPRVILAPDYARFAGTARANLLNQPVIDAAVRSVPVPDVAAEYARVQFSFVPPGEQPLTGPVFVKGTFDGPGARGHRLAWQGERGRYEGSVLVKQGRYAYRYTSPDAQTRSVLRRAFPYANDRYTAFVYFDDIRLGTDRLLAVNMRQAR